MLEAHDRVSRVISIHLGLGGLPLVLAVLLKPWVDAVDSCCLGMGSHVTAASADSSAAILRRVAAMPLLKQAIEEAHRASDALARDLDRSHTLAIPARADAMAALGRLIVLLEEAEPSPSTVALRLGW